MNCHEIAWSVQAELELRAMNRTDVFQRWPVAPHAPKPNILKVHTDPAPSLLEASEECITRASSCKERASSTPRCLTATESGADITLKDQAPPDLMTSGKHFGFLLFWSAATHNCSRLDVPEATTECGRMLTSSSSKPKCLKIRCIMLVSRAM